MWQSDGALRYGTERIAELYYSLAPGSCLTLRANRLSIASPGYHGAPSQPACRRFAGEISPFDFRDGGM